MTWGAFYERNVGPYADAMVTRFNQAKAATGFLQRNQINTGALDIKRVANYKCSDNIFKTEFINRKTKNHGMFVILDWSGSMAEHGKIENAVIQAIKLAFFARKAGIPFEVVTFTSKGTGQGDRPPSDALDPEFKEYASSPNSVRFLQLIHGAIRSEEDFVLAAQNMIMMALGNRPDPRFNMVGTPLTQALDTCTNYIKDFKHRNRLTNLNVMVLSDGDSQDLECYKMEQANSPPADAYEGSVDYIRYMKGKITFRDLSLGVEILADNSFTDRQQMQMMFTMMKTKLGCKLFWVYLKQGIGTGLTIQKMAEEFGEGQRLAEIEDAGRRARETFERDGYASVKDAFGCDEIFLVPIAVVAVETEQIELNDLDKKLRSNAMAQEMTKNMKHSRAENAMAVVLGEAIARAELKQTS